MSSPITEEVMNHVDIRKWLVFSNSKQELIDALTPFGAKFKSIILVSIIVQNKIVQSIKIKITMNLFDELCKKLTQDVANNIVLSVHGKMMNNFALIMQLDIF